jgi:hypothetical protein
MDLSSRPDPPIPKRDRPLGRRIAAAAYFFWLKREISK